MYRFIFVVEFWWKVWKYVYFFWLVDLLYFELFPLQGICLFEAYFEHSWKFDWISVQVIENL